MRLALVTMGAAFGGVRRLRWRLVLPLIAVAMLVGSGGSRAGTHAAQHASAPPTWKNVYDWSRGHGYAGWHSATTSAADYGMQTALGGQPGLWLWPLGGHKTYATSDYAEWAYTAPGTTRLKSVTLSYAWNDKLLANHCIDVGLRDASGTVITRSVACKPPRQSPVTLTLTDPSSNPSSTVLYFQIHVNCGGASSCSKTIPSKDPLKNGAYARLLKVDMTLVDDDDPVIQPSGPLWDVRDHFIDGTQTYGVTLGATDAGSGIVGSSFVYTSQSPHSIHLLGLRIAPCDLLHRTPSLDARICPPTFSWDASVSTPPYPEGTNTFSESALDVAGNVATQSWTTYIDRTPPDSVVASGSLFDLAGQTTDGSDQEDLTITAHDPGADTQKASGIARVWYEEVGVGTIDSSDNPDCTELICPDTYTAEFSVDLSGLSDGEHTFVVKASDLVGHVTEGQTWTVTIASPGDQGPPDASGDTPPDTAGSADAPGGGADGYDPASDPDPACDAYVDAGVPDWCLSGSDSSAAAGVQPAPAAAAAANPATSYAGCGLKAVFWSLGYPRQLTEQLTQYNVGPSCGDYYIAEEPGADKLRPECLTGLRDSWPSNMHAAPVFQWSAWANWVNQGNGNWFAAGVTFRNQMDANGCQPGDRWFVNELPRSWHSPDYTPAQNRAVRARIANALRGLYYGGSQVNVQGFTADVVENQDVSDLGRYKAGLELGYAAHDFWQVVGKYVLGWAKESYNQCKEICEPGKSASAIADGNVNPYSYHEGFLAAAAPATTAYGPVKTTLRAHHLPLLNAIWNSPTAVFNTLLIPIPQMARVIRQQIYSARRIAATQVGAAGRIGFAWKESGLGTTNDPAVAAQLAANLAIALQHAYRSGGTAAAACVDNDGAGTMFYGCPPVGRPGAAPNLGWTAFKIW